MLALRDEYTDEPNRSNAGLVDSRHGLECSGRWQKDEEGKGLVLALLCEQDGVRTESKDRAADIAQIGDSLIVRWNKGAEGAEILRRFQDISTG
ncbi:hypothetical protein [Streptomyces sp. UNOC14_S4]|uniref:hypothetical protein n=1 Tax=Streptomyces sp. UNOC14_S4 TaxID=2872340 RepID=UPI001E3DA750|nr:hypothetical protein [Streptomyces sp. UNOC14_S4]MCC3766634.1 hypothetical protein [Streptomyces sp. UNOC14_S4]